MHPLPDDTISLPINSCTRYCNTAHTKTRVIVEQSFGRWKRRFHVLHSEIRMTPQRACSVIGACAVLHNIAVLLNEPMDDDPLDDDPEGIDPYHGPQRGLAMRDHICNTYFARDSCLTQCVKVDNYTQYF